MTQPTGEHASGVKLASAYVEVTGKTDALKTDATKNLDAIADHGKVVGQQAADNIVTAVGNAGTPAAQGFFNKFHSFATTSGRDMGANAGTALISGMKDGMAESDLVQGLDKHFQAINSKMSTAGRDAGMIFHGQWEQLLNEKLDRSKYFGTQHGAAVAEGISEQLAQMDRGGLKDYIDRMQSWKIDAQRSVMDIGNTYAQMASAGSYSLDQLKQKHIELASAQAKVKEGTLNISEAQQRLRSMGRDVENVATSAAMGESFKRASEGVAGLSSHLGEAGEQAGGLGEKLGGLMGPLAALASPEALGIGAVLGVVGALGEVVNKVNELGEQWEELGHKIEIQTGATGEQLEQMKADVGDVYKGVTTNMSQTESIFAAVSKGMKDTGQGAKDVTTQLAHLQSMGQGVNAVDLGTAFKGFNIAGDAAQQTDVINTLLKTAQDTQMPIGEFVSTTQRLAPVMDTLHISMKDTLGMLDEFGQAGIKPEQTFIMLNKAAQDATKHGKDFRTALQEDIDAIKNAPTEEDAQKKAAKIFGASAGRGGAAQMTQAIRSGQLNLDPAYLAQLEQADGLVNKTWHDTLTWKDTWTLFKHDASDALRPLSEELHEKVQAGLENVVNWLSAHQGQIVGFATGVTHGFEGLVSGIGKVIDYLKPAFTQIKPQLDDFAKAFGPMAVSIGKDVLPVVEALGGALLVTFKDIIEHSGPTLEFFAHLFEDVKKVADYIHDHFGPDAKTTLDQFKQDWQGVRDDIGHVVDAVKDVEHWIDEAGKKITQWKDDLNRIHIPGLPGGGHMFGGAIHAQEGIGIPGYGGGDIVPAMLEPGEHVFTKEDVSAMGGQGSMYMLRSMIQAGLLQDILGFQTGGPIPQAGGQPNLPGQPWDEPGATDYLPMDEAHIAWNLFRRQWNSDKLYQYTDPKTHGNRDPGMQVRGHGSDSIIMPPDAYERAIEPYLTAPFNVQVGARLGGAIHFQTGGDVPDPHHNFYKDWYGPGSGWSPGDVGTLPGPLQQWAAAHPDAVNAPLPPSVPPTVGLNRFGVAVPLPKPHLVGESEPKERESAPERVSKASDKADKLDKGIKYGRMGLGWAGDADRFGGVGSRLGTVAESLEVLEPVSKAAGAFALPFAAIGAANWGLNLLGKTGALGADAPTNLSPAERLQQWWFHFSTAPSEYAKHGNRHGPWDQWRPGYKGSTPQGFHIPGTNTNLGDIGKSIGDLLGFGPGGFLNHSTGGAIHPAMGNQREKGWVIDRYKALGMKPARFQVGGAVAGGTQSWGGLNDVKALLAAESGRTPYVFGGYSPRGVDCSGLVAEAVEIYMGLPMSGGHPMSTGNEGAWLAAHGFTQGMGPEGSFRVGFYNGGPGGGHTALTLPDGTNAESGGSGGGVRLGGGAAGANSSEFTEHYYLPAREVVSPSGWSGASSGGGGTGGASGATAGFSGGGGGGAGGGNYGGAGGGGLWDAVAQAESSGNWSNQDTGGSGHYGGLQFSPSTWAAYGGTDFAANPAEASREQQIEVANRTAFTGWKGTPPQGLQAWETITQGKVPGVTTATSAAAFGSGGGNYGGASPADYSPGGAGGGTGGVTPEQLSAQDSKISGKQRSLDVINQRIVEAQQRLTAAQNKEVPDTDKGQATHDKAVAAAQQRVKDLEAERDRAQGDIDSLNEERAGMEGGGSKSLVAAKDRVTEANRRLTDAQSKLDEDRANPAKKPSEIIADENAVAAAKEAVAKAQEHQQKVESAPPKKGKKGEPGGGAGWTDEDTGELFGIGYKGIQEQLPEGFSNPLEWGTTKSLSAGLKFFGALLGGDGKEAYNSLLGGGGAGGGNGQVSPYVQSLIAQVPGYTGGQQGGGDNVYNHTVNYNGNITGNVDPDPSMAGVRGLLRTMGALTG